VPASCRYEIKKPPLINFSEGFLFHKIVGVGEILLDFSDVGGLESFRTGDYIEGNGFAFGEGFESITLNGGEVHEYIVTIVLFDKPETLGVIEPFHFTLCHFPYLLCSLRSVAGTALIAAVAGVLRQENPIMAGFQMRRKLPKHTAYYFTKYHAIIYTVKYI
jgi:hypothetical protein